MLAVIVASCNSEQKAEPFTLYRNSALYSESGQRCSKFND
jgi:hypothetical protein